MYTINSMLYLPEILPVSGVSIAMGGKQIGRITGYIALMMGTNSSALMIFLTVFVRLLIE